MHVWAPALKKYPHFDWDLPVQEIDALVKDPGRVAANAFYPFLRYTQSWQPFRSRPEGKPDKKERPILSSASRRDAAIFSYYRHLLSTPYEQALAEAGIGECVTAYRKLTDPGGRGKSNIEFARDAFLKVRELGHCGVVALDIKSFFESLDHGHLRRLWLRLIGMQRLPEDHDAVFRAVTAYAVADRDAVYERLGHSRKEMVGERERYVSVTPFREMPRKICFVTTSSARRFAETEARTIASLIRTKNPLASLRDLRSLTSSRTCTCLSSTKQSSHPYPEPGAFISDTRTTSSSLSPAATQRPVLFFWRQSDPLNSARPARHSSHRKPQSICSGRREIISRSNSLRATKEKTGLNIGLSV